MKKRLTFLFALLSLLVIGANAQKSWNFSDWTAETIAADKTVDGLTVKATSSKTVAIDASKKTVDDVEYTQRLKLGGTAGADNRILQFEVDGPSTIDVVLSSGNSTDDRALNVWEGDYAKNGEKGSLQALAAGPTKETYTYEGGAGKITLGSANSGVNIYAIYVTPIADDAAGDAVTFDFTGDEAPYGVPANSGAAGGADLEAVNEGVTLKFERGGAFYLPYFSANSLYIRGGNTGYFLAPEGKTITKVEINVKSNPSYISLEGSTTTDNTITWEGDATGVKFKVNANVSITTAVVTLADATADSDNSVVEGLSAPEATVEITEIAESIQSGDDLEVKVKITNTGKGAIERLVVDAYTDIWNDTWGNSKTITNLAAGASEEVTILLDEVETNKESFQLKIQAVVYGKGITFESEEKTVKVAAPAPKLTVAISEAPESVIANQNFTVKGRVTNIGSVDAADIHVVAVVNNVEWSGSTSTITSLEADGEYSDVTVNVNEIDVDGESFTLKLRALVKFGDSTVQFESAEKTIAYDATSTEGIDLAVTNVEAPASVVLTDDVKDVEIKVTVKNVGTADVTGAVVKAEITDKYGLHELTSNKFDLKAGEETTASVWFENLEPGFFTFNVRVVAEGDENEENDWNENEDIRVDLLAEDAAIDLAVTNVEAPTSVTLTDDVKDVEIKVTVENVGTADVTDAVIKAEITDAQGLHELTSNKFDLKAGEETTVSVFFENLEPGFLTVNVHVVAEGDENEENDWNDPEDIRIDLIAAPEEEAEIEVTAIQAPETVSDATFDVTVVVKSTAAVEGAKVTLNVPGYYTDEKTVDLKAGENEVTFTIDVEEAGLKSGSVPYELSAWATVDGEQYWYDDEENGAVKVVINYTTGIAAVKAAIAEGAEIYNLNGQRLSTPAKGIVIINGKKVAVK